jgi:hypothetical protein
MMTRIKSERNRYRWTNRIIAVGVVVYLALAIGREGRAKREEIFPFASWSLFSMVPNEADDYSLRILAVNGKAVEPPLYFEDSIHLFSNATDHSARMSIEHLGKAVERGDAHEIEKVRAYLESLHFKSPEREQRVVQYEVVRRRYDPLKRWRDRHAFSAVQRLAKFETRGPL